MKEHASDSGKGEKRVERAVEYVQDRWFPVNEELLAKIQRGIRDDSYRQDFSRFLKDLESDLSLYSYTIKQVGKLLQTEGEDLPHGVTPTEILTFAGFDRLQQILGDEANVVSAFQLTEAEELQIARFQEMLVSAATARKLSEAYYIDPDLAYSTALLRQVGYALVAWNYPGLYEEVIQNLEPGQILDVELSRRIGLSPTLLAIKVFEESGIPIETSIGFGMIDEEIQETYGEEFIVMPSELLEVCYVGEALARAFQGDRYPTAKDDWHYAQREIEEKLGEDGFPKIYEHLIESSLGYAEVMPQIAQWAIPEEALAYIDAHSHEPSENQNPYLTICSPAVARKMKTVYEAAEACMLSPQNVRSLIDQVLPEAGYTAGVIYTPDPTMMMLIPQLDFGALRLRTPRAIDYSIVLSNADMVALAFQSDEPILQYKMDEQDRLVTAIAGVVGHSRRVGVLYLEIPEAVTDFIGDQKVIHFKAIRHALSDALYLQ